MSDVNPYKMAYERERFARQKAEQLLDEKTRRLYASVVNLQATVDQLKDIQEQLGQAEKIASIGQLSVGVAHEINNPLGFCLSNMIMLQEYLHSIVKLDAVMINNLPEITDSALAKKYQQVRVEEDIDFVINDLKSLLTDTVNGLRRIGNIVDDLKKVTHVGEFKQELCDINQIIIDSLNVVWAELKYTMTIEKIFADLPRVHCHGAEIH